VYYGGLSLSIELSEPSAGRPNAGLFILEERPVVTTAAGRECWPVAGQMTGDDAVLAGFDRRRPAVGIVSESIYSAVSRRWRQKKRSSHAAVLRK
jgi:hypothetical protein